MLDKLSPLVWAAIAFLFLIFILVNAWMIALLRHGDPRSLNQNMQRPRKDASALHSDFQNLAKVARNPFREEQENLARLAEEVKKLKS